MTTEKESELERVTRLRGFRYGLHDFLAELDVNALKAVNDNVEANYLNESSLLDRKTKELLIIIACVAQGDMVSHIQIHMHDANKAGASPEEILEALNLVRNWVGIRGVIGLEAWRATFRPDIPTIDRVVELR